jgi:hypothetical protein
MLTRETSERAQRAWSLHWQFVTMMHAACLWPERHDAGEILGEWWGIAFPGRELTNEDFTSDIFDRVRAALAERGGVVKPILPENPFTDYVHDNLEID